MLVTKLYKHKQIPTIYRQISTMLFQTSLLLSLSSYYLPINVLLLLQVRNLKKRHGNKHPAGLCDILNYS